MNARTAHPAHPLRIVAVSGGLQRPSRSAALAEHLLDLIADEVPCEQRLVDVGQLAPMFAGAVGRSQLPEAMERELAAVEQADVLVVATPVYRGSYPGLFKHFFDFVGQDALIDKPVLLAATGGSERHALVIDHQLRPLFSFFQARTLPLGVYATDKDFVDYRLRDDALINRASLAVQRALPLLPWARHAQASRAGVVALA
ncbi:FMN reductase [Acidovorax sp. sic0104]|uniref:FMN reductase n=1 Tax=Acidovorax sp. sic0104 TaxID=2854784 RepID=UPI001C43E827|nr:FMN reductase [Acidovorax sp. sic0104]MBV7542301.1 FMN reductase [Acidovorax sp. sic0104]